MTQQPPPPPTAGERTPPPAETGVWGTAPQTPARRHSSMPYPGTNRMAVAAVSFGILGLVPPLVLPMLDYGPLLLLPLVGMVLGIVALVQLRRHPQGGRGMAVTGIVLGAGVLVVLAVGVAALLRGPGDAGGSEGRSGSMTPVRSLKPGDCFNGLGARVKSVTPRSCQEAHEAEVVTTITLPEGTYPGSEQVKALVQQGCAKAMQPLLDAAFLSELRIFAFFPESAPSWSRGRTVTCIVTPQDGAIDTSVLR